VDPGCGTCFGQCVPVQPPSCDEATPCPEGYECIMECWTCDPNWPDCGCDPATGQDCARCVGTCVPVNPPECLSDQDCIFPNGEIGYCVNGQCVFDQIVCSDGTACPPGMICMEVCTDCDPASPDCVPGCVGYCVPDQPAECYSDYDCIDSAGQLGRCVEGRCVFGGLECTADWACPPGYRCDLVQCLPDCDSTTGNCCVGVCVPDGQVYCNSDEECFAADGQMGRCVNGQCVFNGCVCPDVWAPVCGADGVTYPNDCYAACAGVPVVFYGECGTDPLNCFSDGECPAGMYCEFCATTDPAGNCSEMGMCLPLPQMVCQGDADCPQGFTCMLTCDAGPFCDPAVDPNCSPTCDPTIDPNCTTTCVGQCVPLETGCIQTGCNGEVCAPFPVNTTCVWLPEYACLQLTTCQALYTSDGQMTCGFEQTPEYLDCLLQITNPPTCENGMTCPDGMICQTFCDAAGICQTGCFTSDCVCPEIYDPVCGADGVTYENVCQLSCANVEFAYAGTCDQTRP
jgi:hypothetical protein